MKKLIYCINYILIRLFNYAIFSEFSKDILIEKTDEFKNITTYYCGYHKNFNINDWRFSTNNSRKNIEYIKLKLLKFI